MKQIRLKNYGENETKNPDKSHIITIETCANPWYDGCDGGGTNCPCCYESHKQKNLTCGFGCEPSRTSIPKDCPL